MVYEKLGKKSHRSDTILECDSNISKYGGDSMGVIGFKISAKLLVDLQKLIKRADKAMNVLERANHNKIIYPELKVDLQKMIEKLESQYRLSEYEDPMARDRALEKAKKDAEQ